MNGGRENTVNNGVAYGIFMNIDSADYTDDEKGTAILHVLRMETHNGITKAAMLKVIDYLLHLAFDVRETEEVDGGESEANDT